jgi:hypothetical protein
MRTFNNAPRKAPYTNLTFKQNVYVAANQAVKTTTAGLATTYTGLSLTNPVTNTKKLILLEFGWGQHAAAAAGVIGIMGGAITSTHTAAEDIVPKNMYMGSANTSIAIVDTDCTISTPVLYKVFGSTGSVATTGYGTQPLTMVDLKGGIIVNPGYFIASYISVVTTSALIFYFSWEEV